MSVSTETCNQARPGRRRPRIPPNIVRIDKCHEAWWKRNSEWDPCCQLSIWCLWSREVQQRPKLVPPLGAHLQHVMELTCEPVSQRLTSKYTQININSSKITIKITIKIKTKNFISIKSLYNLSSHYKNYISLDNCNVKERCKNKQNKKMAKLERREWYLPDTCPQTGKDDRLERVEEKKDL